VVTHQLQVEHRTAKVRWPETDVLPLSHSTLHPCVVAKSSTSFSWCKGGEVTAARWQVALYDSIFHVISRSSEVPLRTGISIPLRLTYLSFLSCRCAESSFFCGTPTPGFKKLGLQLRFQPLKMPRLHLRLWVKHRLLNLCECGSDR